MGFGRSQVSWLRTPRRAFPVSRRLTSGSLQRISARSQWRDRAGFAPGFPGHRPLNGASIPHRATPSHGR